MGYIVNAANCCCGKTSICCANTVSEVLYMTVENGCGVWTDRLFYDPTILPGPCWRGTISVKCPFGAGCAGASVVLEVTLCCEASALWFISVRCLPDPGVVTSAISVTCNPFLADTVALAVCFDCIDRLWIVE